MHARVELEQHAERDPALARGPREPERDLVGVDGGRDRDALGEVGEARELLRADDRIADEDVVDAGVGHHLGLAELRHLHADRAGVDLEARDLRQLVRLRVRPDRDARLGGASGDPGDVRAHDVEVDHDLRRVGGELDERRDALELLRPGVWR